MRMQPFTVAWTADQVDALKARIAAAVVPPAPEGAGWSLGCDRDFLLKVRDYWLDGYDWQAAVDDLNRYPQFIAEIDGFPIHFIHVKGEGESRRPLLMTHGWPGSYYEFWDVVDRLAYPSRHGGDAADAFDLVMPSLPGYAFSGKPSQPIGPTATAAMWDKLMTQVLGYPTYLAQGGDWGSLVTASLGLDHGDTVRGIHLNMVALRSSMPPQNPAEEQWAAKAMRAYQTLSAYSMLQMWKPMSLAYVAAGNPLGQAAWILERFHDWSDLSQGDLEAVYGLDHLITNIMLYVMNDSFESAIWFYNGLIREGGRELGEGETCETPLGIAAFPGDALLPVPPRSRVELVASKLMHWTDMPAGGHFAAMEQPEAFAADVKSWAAKVWPAGS
jgi:pimeloyl-ACP methyl ester carboxylesterase